MFIDEYLMNAEDQRRAFPPAIMPGWSIDELGFSVYQSPAVVPEKRHFQAAGNAYDRPAWYKRLFGVRENPNDTALMFHHWMARHVPGYWNMFYYKEEALNASVKLCFADQKCIILYGVYYGSGLIRSEGPVLSLVEGGKENILLCQSSDDKSICYHEHRNKAHQYEHRNPSWQAARSVVNVFAIVAAIPPRG